MKTVPPASSSWEDLRKRARQLENEVDSKLLSLNKLNAQAHDHILSSRNYKTIDSSSSSKEKIDEMTHEIESLLIKLTDVNDQMASYFGPSSTLKPLNNDPSSKSSNLSPNINPTVLHTVQRHRDILQDYGSEFQRIQSNIRARLEREQLLSKSGSNRGKKINESDHFSDHRDDDDPYLKEYEHARSSDRLLNEQISIAIATKEHLQSQRSGLKDITKKLHTLTKRYPAISNVMQKINWRKRRDSIIVGLVISICLFLMFIYATR